VGVSARRTGGAPVRQFCVMSDESNTGFAMDERLRGRVNHPNAAVATTMSPSIASQASMASWPTRCSRTPLRAYCGQPAQTLPARSQLAQLSVQRGDTNTCHAAAPPFKGISDLCWMLCREWAASLAVLAMLPNVIEDAACGRDGSVEPRLGDQRMALVVVCDHKRVRLRAISWRLEKRVGGVMPCSSLATRSSASAICGSLAPGAEPAEE